MLNTIEYNNKHDINAHHECIYRQIYKIIKTELAEKIYELKKIYPKLFFNFFKITQPDKKISLMQKLNSKLLENSYKKNQDDYNQTIGDIRRLYIERLDSRNVLFGEVFSKTQLFLNYISEMD